jgi:hypothetical protein
VDVPKDTIIIADPQKLGNLLVKTPIENTINISEIEEHNKSKLLTELPSLTSEKIEESVEFLVYELIKVKITDPNAVVILQKQDNNDTLII